MTRTDKSYIENVLISLLNEPSTRIMVAKVGRERTVKAYVNSVIREDFPELLDVQAEEIRENVMKKIRSCEYPTAEIPTSGVKLNLAELLYLTDLKEGDLSVVSWTLEALGNVMQDNEDERVEKIGEALTAIKEILNSRGEPKGKNI